MERHYTAILLKLHKLGVYMPFDPAVILESQAPWMALCLALILYIVRIQNSQIQEITKALSALVLAYQKHDMRAEDIERDLKTVRDWCVAESGNNECRPGG